MSERPKGGEALQPGAHPPVGRTGAASGQPPSAAVAAALVRRHAQAESETLVHLASSDRRAEEIGRALRGLAPQAEALVLPPWDCLPYDRAPPSPDVMGRRMSVLSVLTRKPSRPLVLVTSPDAIVQRLPPSSIVSDAFLTLRRGQSVDRDALAAFADATGYRGDSRVDEPGEIALFGEVIDIFPADAARPVRLSLDEAGTLVELRRYDPATQRTEDEIEELILGPASELILSGEAARAAGDEHRLAQAYGGLQTLFDLIPKPAFSRDPEALSRLQLVGEQIDEAFDARRTLGAREEKAPPPSDLYLSKEDLAASLERWAAIDLDLTTIEPVIGLATRRNPGRALCELVERHRAEGRRVVLAGVAAETRAMAKAVRRGLDLVPGEVESWDAALSLPAGSIAVLGADLEAGFLDAGLDLLVVSASDVFGGRLVDRASARPTLVADPDFRIDDVVIHEDHGVGVLRDLELVEVNGTERDLLRIEYHGETSALVPIDEIGLVWRYGAGAHAVGLDRLKGDTWQKRKAEVSRQIDETARHLVALAKARAAASCPPIVPPREPFARFVARFAYPETPDQAAAIEAVLDDLASGRPMDRLVCGDVGFGKTEVALRAAAAVALGGRQVAIVAPTTVLARQHLQTFQRRFAGTGIEVAPLSRLVSSTEARAVRDGLASGAVRIVVGTHAVAGKSIAFADLGLMVIDEEQKFGTAAKERLHALAGHGHLLTMTATPIPRTLQSALVGIQDVSVIASPPSRRRPIRTFLVPFDGATVRTALLREKRRGGQSFLVVPRIEDIDAMAGRLRELVPELAVKIAHGDLAAEQADEVMVGFADGDGDVLLATNIIESGLDVPRANTMLVWHPNRFGLAQLHQLRGRVGRGRNQGIAYLLADPDEEMPEATRARLSTLEAFDRLGSGLAISARDLDFRGAGDLVGEEQAGHVKLIGAALYQRLLSRAMALAKGERVETAAKPVLNLGEAGAIPTDYVPDAITRINLYARLARMDEIGDIDAFEEELADRFGTLPAAASTLLTCTRLQSLAAAAGVRQVDAGPKGIALTLPKAMGAVLKRIRPLVPAAQAKEERLVIPGNFDDFDARLTTVERLLTRLAP
ncbi:MAG TPA: DEAD/DEAH box helicase [Aliidongia sp.]|uniref:DEAD/DEAH box helicase n=1 Tax=Aliidongia sp. TaxID=1914230 RepID=UPI002DDD2BEF|nr:DEAD/DEAH box helicase [Aliidongia sp.]HEV2677352.1 DEAD/DEAH box helicase [Aliidongia sp.]